MTGKTISHFRVLEKLGGGGMGVVYLGEDTRLKRPVALKFLPAHLSTDDDAKLRFTQEAQAASALNHANICAIHDIGETEDGQMFIAMAHYEGETLKRKLDRGSIPPAEAFDITMQIADGLGAAHEKGIVHRDIKPANILITDRGRAIILDFGLAKLAGAVDLTKSGSTLGTVSYMAPEQVRAEAADHRTDIFSLGVLLYEMLTGRRPFTGDYEQAISYAILNEEADAPSSVNHALSVDIDRTLQTALQKDPSERFENMRAFQTAIRNLARTSSVTHLPSAAPGARKRQLPAIALIAVAIVVLAAAVAIFFLMRRAAPEASEDRQARLAVLPFANLGPPDEAYFAEGLTEELTSRLASIEALAVISRSSAARVAESEKSISEIGRELDVSYILEGAVRWDKRTDGSSIVRITPQLIRVSDDTHIWTDTYQREVEGIFQIQEEVATNVVQALNLRLLQRERDQLAERPTASIRAYDAYLRGIALRRTVKNDPQRAARAFEEALSYDSTFAEAHYLASHMYSLAVWLGLPQDQARFEKAARDHAAAGERLAPASFGQHLASGYAAYYLDVDFERALREFEAAAKLRPGSGEVLEATAWVNRRLGKFELALEMLERAFALDPLSALIAQEGAITYMTLRRHDDAQRMLDRAIQLEPANPGPYCWKSMNMLLKAGSESDARSAEAAVPRDSDFVPCWWANLSSRDFDRIIEDLEASRVDPAKLEWYGLLFPREIAVYHYRSAITHRLAGNRERELQSWQQLLDVIRRDLPATERTTSRLRTTEARAQFAIALASAGLGNKESALRTLNTLITKTQNDAFVVATFRVHIAYIYVMLEMHDEAIRLLEEDLTEAGFSTGHWLSMPFWDPLRDDPRFQQLESRFDVTS